MNTATLETKIPTPLPAEMDAMTDSLLKTHEMSDVDPRTVTAIEYASPLPGGQPGEHELEIILNPNSHTARIGFRYEGEIHGMYFRFKRGGLESADRTTNGFQQCDAEREEWFRDTLDRMKNDKNPDAKLSFRFHTEEPVALKF